MRKFCFALTTLLAASTPGITRASSPATPQVYTLNPESVRQTIDGFGASDAWSMCFIGERDEETCNNVADLLFSRETDTEGNPLGIGLSIWRFNIGAGSVEQGDSSQINRSTRTECFLLPDGTYDWEKQRGQRRFMKLARERGVETLLGFFNSPPVYYTKNGLATNTGRDGTFNLQENRYGDFARFIADVVDSLAIKEGLTLDYISPVNEPDGHWNWQGPKQEGTPAIKTEIARLTRMLDEEFTSRGINSRIIIPESSDYRCMMSTHETDHTRGYEIQSFFSADSTDTYVGDLKNLPRMMAGHSYWTNTPVEAMRDYRIQLRDSLKKYGVDFWQSEVCIMGNDEEIGGGHGFDRTMKTALYVARLIHHDLVYADARSWQWWRAVGGNYKDGLLFQSRRRGEHTDTIVDSKLLWCLGNYSRFIKPGAKRIEVTRPGVSTDETADQATDPTGLMVSSFINPDGKIATVVINYAADEAEATFLMPGKDSATWKLYRTSDTEGENLRPVATTASVSSLSFPGRSVTTIVEE